MNCLGNFLEFIDHSFERRLQNIDPLNSTGGAVGTRDSLVYCTSPVVAAEEPVTLAKQGPEKDPGVRNAELSEPRLEILNRGFLEAAA